MGSVIPNEKEELSCFSLLPVFIDIPPSPFCKVLIIEFPFQTCPVFFSRFYDSLGKYRFKKKKKKKKINKTMKLLAFFFFNTLRS